VGLVAGDDHDLGEVVGGRVGRRRGGRDRGVVDDRERRRVNNELGGLHVEPDMGRSGEAPAGGSTVTLTGSGLAGLTTLQVGPTLLGSSAFTVVDDHTVTFTALAEASGVADVIARTPVGFSPIGPASTYTYH
jgi:hypothetical protein